MVGAGRITLGRALPLPDRGTSLHWAFVAAIAGLLALVAIGAASAPSPIGPLLVLAAAAPFVAMIVGNLRRLLLAAVIMDIPFQWDVHLFYRPAEAELGAIGGLGLSVTTIALAGLYALWLAEALAAPGGAVAPRLRSSIPLLAYVGLTALSLFVAQDTTFAAFEVALLVQTFLLYLYVASTVRREADVRFVWAMLLGSLLLQSVVMLVMRYSGLDLGGVGFSTQPQPGGGVTLDRVIGTFGSPNAAASYLALLLMPALTLLAVPTGRWFKRLAVVAFALGLTALVLTFSRGGWLAFGLGIVVVAVAARRRGWLPGRVWLPLAAVAVVLVALFGATISMRLTSDDHGAAYSRVPLMRLAGEMIEQRPLLGVGANNFAVALPEFAGPDFTQEWVYTVHNKFLLVWAEAGLGALVAFLWFLAATLRRGWQCWRADDTLVAALALGLTAGVAGHVAHMTVDLFNARPQVQLLWLVAGLLTALHAMRTESAA